MSGVPQVFVRNESGQTWGPLALGTVEMLIEAAVITGRILVSEDGVNFTWPGRFPHLREAFPRELWGTPAQNGAKPGDLHAQGPGGAGARGAPPTLTPAPGATGPRGAPPTLTPAPVEPAMASAAAAPQVTRAPQPVAMMSSPETMPTAGELTESSAVRLYAIAALGKHTGKLSLKLPDCVVEIHFRKGNPELVESTHPEDGLDTFLLAQSLVPKDRLEAAKQVGGDLVSVLFAQGLLQPATAFTHLLRRATLILFRGLYATAGSFTFAPGDFPSQKAMPLGHRWGLLADFVRRVPVPELKRRLKPVLEQPMLKSTGALEVHDLKLTPQETRALGGVDGVRSLAQLCAESPQDSETFLRLAFLLRELELVSFNPEPQRRSEGQPASSGAQGGAAQARVAAAAPPPPASSEAPAWIRASTQNASNTPPPAGGAPASGVTAGTAASAAGGSQGARASATPVGAAGASQAARATGASVGAANVSQGARPAAAPAGAAAQARATPKPLTPPPAAHRPPTPPPTTTPPPSSPAEQLEQLRARLAKVKEQNHFERLGVADSADPLAVKMAYFKLARLFHPDTVSPGASAEVMKLNEDIFAAVGEAYRVLIDETSRAKYVEELKSGAGEFDIQQLLAAEEHFHKATLLVKGRRFAEAMALLDQAIQMNPEEGEFYAWRGYARYFVNADKKVGLNEANRDLNLALKKNDKCAIAWFYMGQLAKLSGDGTTALKHFKKTLDLQPQHIDAQREVRMLTKK